MGEDIGHSPDLNNSDEFQIYPVPNYEQEDFIGAIEGFLKYPKVPKYFQHLNYDRGNSQTHV